uniref:Uncharacterized protein LOC111127899 isoform X2 n=1 Tax=Crassostrea virginica TaxID=6565 RepID=A0A8B8DMD2_CRAVI|nr:uncharacterized protein LOC111127899 isoform X2 [Crassostrea virginica]
MDVFVFRLSLLFWMAYNTVANSTFSVYINEPTWNQLDGTMQITCTVLGLTENDALQYEIELHRRRNYNITRLVKSTPSNLDQTDNKYYWNNLTKDKITGKYRATVHLQVNNTTFQDQEIYTCYATVDSVTRFRSLMIPDKVNKTSYVIIRSMDVLFKDIPDACCKYGYTIFEDDSVLNEIQLLQNESAYFPVWPIFNTSNQNVTLAKPWVSYEGCHNISTTETTEKMDCKKLSVTEWLNKTDELPLIGMMLNSSCVLLEPDQLVGNNVSYSYCRDPNPEMGSNVYITVHSIIDKITLHQVDTEEMNTGCEAAYIDIKTSKLYRIPCSGSSRCDVFCLNQDGSNASAHGHKKWDDARNICNNLNTSLPGINSTFITMERARIINSTVCLAVVQTSSIAFQPIIKQITKENDGKVSTTIPRNSSQTFTFVCKDNKDIRQLVPYVCDSHSSSGETGEFPTSSTENFRIEGTTNEDTPDVSLKPNSAEPEGVSSKQMVKIIIASVVASLVTLVVLCVIVSLYRKRISQRNENLRIKTEVKTNTYTPPSEELNDNNRRTEGDIQLEEMYSTAEETDSSHIKRCSKEHVNNKNTEDEDLGEYDVLRGKRQNEEAPQSENIYDRTNNVVSGIYDSTSTQPVVDIYTI